jgi:hypothetical protein
MPLLFGILFGSGCGVYAWAYSAAFPAQGVGLLRIAAVAILSGLGAWAILWRLQREWNGKR